MGLSDRDYMHERHRRVLNARPRDTRPFTPPKETSTLVVVGWWLVVAFLLFKAFGWWEQQRQHKRVRVTSVPVERAAPAPAPVPEPPRVQQAWPAAVRSDPPPPPQQVPYRSGTVYLCRNPDRSTFWAQAPCSSHGAVLERMTQVPEDLSFDAQVRIAEERRRALTPPSIQVSATPAAMPLPASSHKAACEGLDHRVRELDAIARQPQTAGMQDWIRSERKSARDEQFRLRC